MTTSSTELVSMFERLQSVVLSTSGTESFLQELSVLATTATDRPLSCGITVRRDGLPLTVASSDTRAQALDETQYVVGEGPCLHSLATGKTVLVDDLDRESRWPKYLDRVRSSDLRCSLSVPLRVDGVPVGAMNLYSFSDPDVFTPEVQSRCQVFAALASGALAINMGRAADRRLLDELDGALASRTVIDQAIGILMAQQRCPADDAFALLRMRSQSAQLKLRDVAADLITRVSGQAPQPGRPFDRG